MKLSQPALSLLEETIKQAIGKYACGCEQTVVTDIHLQANQSSGEFSIFDDDDKELASTTIEEWMTYEAMILRKHGTHPEQSALQPQEPGCF